MKNSTIALIGAILLLLSALSSCKTPQPIDPQPEPDKKVSVRFNISPEVSTPPATPLQSSSQDLVAIQIYSHDKEATYAYAYGLFDNYSKLPEIEMLENGVYSIETTIIPSGQLIIATKSDGAFYKPFTIGITPTLVGNELTYTASSFGFISKGDADINEGGRKTNYRRPQIERYAGYSGQFSPKTSPVVNITAKRVYAQLRINVSGLTTGTVEVEMADAPLIVVDSRYNKRDTTVVLGLAGTTPASGGWVDDTYAEVVNCTVTHITPSGQRVLITPVGGQRLSIKRNYTHPINVRLDGSASTAITLEGGEMIDATPVEIG